MPLHFIDPLADEPTPDLIGTLSAEAAASMRRRYDQRMEDMRRQYPDSYGYDESWRRQCIANIYGRNTLPAEELALLPQFRVCRSCRNLAHHYAAAGDPTRARLFGSFVDEFEQTYERNIR